MTLEYPSTDSRKNLKYEISWKFAQREQNGSRRTHGQTDRQTDRQTDIHDEANSRFSQFVERA